MRSAQYAHGWTCPYCGYAMDGTTGVEGRGDELPDTGDVGMCLACGRIAEFVRVAGSVHLRIMDPVKLADALTDPRVVLSLEAWRTARAQTLLRGDRWAGQ